VRDLQKGLDTFLGRTLFGEASAYYILRCRTTKKVAWLSSLPVGTQEIQRKPATVAGKGQAPPGGKRLYST
jgi:hypothetical protein